MIQRSIVFLCCGLSLLLMILGCERETPTSITNKDQKRALDHLSQPGSPTLNQGMGIFAGGSCILDWNYDPKIKGEPHWPGIRPEYALCGEGMEQSPINISTSQAIPSRMRPLKIYSNASDMKVIHCGQAIRMDIYNSTSASGRMIERAFIFLGQKKFSLDHIHIHSPSEHTINDQHFPLEFHLVHKANDGKIAVIGVMVKAGRKHRHLAKFWHKLPELFPHSDGSKSIVVERFNIKSLLPKRIPRTFRYDGSLTTPPCSQGLRWLVTTEPIEMSSSQISTYQNFFYTPNGGPFPNGNRRSIRPLNGRIVVTEKQRRYDKRYAGQ